MAILQFKCMGNVYSAPNISAMPALTKKLNALKKCTQYTRQTATLTLDKS